MDKMVYIVQTHENASDKADYISVFGSLKEAAKKYNEAIADAEEICGNDGFEDCFVTEDKAAELEGKAINEEYEAVDGGYSQTVSLFSSAIQL